MTMSVIYSSQPTPFITLKSVEKQHLATK